MPKRDEPELKRNAGKFADSEPVGPRYENQTGGHPLSDGDIPLFSELNADLEEYSYAIESEQNNKLERSDGQILNSTDGEVPEPSGLINLKPICSVEEAVEPENAGKARSKSYYFSIKRSPAAEKREDKSLGKRPERGLGHPSEYIKRVDNINMPVVKIVKQSGKTYRFEDFPISMGRSKACEVPVGGRGVSRRHAQLDFNEETREFIITDLKSLNGIKVNDEKVLEVALRQGDSIQIGEAELTFYFEEGSEDEPTPAGMPGVGYEADSYQADNPPSEPQSDEHERDEDAHTVSVESAGVDDAGIDSDIDNLDELLNGTDFDDDLIDESLKNDLLQAESGPVNALEEAEEDDFNNKDDNRVMAGFLAVTAVALFFAACFFAYQLFLAEPEPIQVVAVDEINAAESEPEPDGLLNQAPTDEEEAARVAQSIESMDEVQLIDEGAGSGEMEGDQGSDHVFGQEIEEKVPSETDLDSSESPGERLGAVEKGHKGHIDTESPQEPKLANHLLVIPRKVGEGGVQQSVVAPAEGAAPHAEQPVKDDSSWKARRLLGEADKMFQTGYGRKLLTQLKSLKEQPTIGAPLKEELDSTYSKIKGLVNRYSEGLKAYESGDKSGAFSTWADFMKEERGHYGGNTSYYSKQVNEKVVTEYMARAKRATESGDYHHAYGLWEKAAKIDETGVVQDELNRVHQEVEALYNEGLRLEGANLNNALSAWSEILRRVPQGHEFHTKASSKLSWYDQWRK